MPHTIPTEHDLWRGHHVRLRAVTVEDEEAFHADGQDTDTARYGDEIKLPYSRANLIKRLQKDRDPDDHNIWLGVEECVSGNLVGSVTVHGASVRHRTFEYGIAIFRARRTRGYAREAIALMMRFYFQELGYHRAWSTVYEFNEPSIGLHRALGFTEEGRLRQNLFTHGRFYDEIIFGMLASEADGLISTLPTQQFKG